MFVRPRKQKPCKKGSIWCAHFANWGPQKLPKGLTPIRKVGSKEAHSEFWRVPKGSSQAGEPPCIPRRHGSIKNRTSRTPFVGAQWQWLSIFATRRTSPLFLLISFPPSSSTFPFGACTGVLHLKYVVEFSAKYRQLLNCLFCVEANSVCPRRTAASPFITGLQASDFPHRALLLPLIPSFLEIIWDPCMRFPVTFLSRSLSSAHLPKFYRHLSSTLCNFCDLFCIF